MLCWRPPKQFCHAMWWGGALWVQMRSTLLHEGQHPWNHPHQDHFLLQMRCHIAITLIVHGVICKGKEPNTLHLCFHNNKHPQLLATQCQRLVENCHWSVSHNCTKDPAFYQPGGTSILSPTNWWPARLVLAFLAKKASPSLWKIIHFSDKCFF